MRSGRAAWIFAVAALLLAAGGVFLLPHRSFALEALASIHALHLAARLRRGVLPPLPGGAPQFVAIALREACSSVLRAAVLLGALAILAWTTGKFRLKMPVVVAASLLAARRGLLDLRPQIPGHVHCT